VRRLLSGAARSLASIRRGLEGIALKTSMHGTFLLVIAMLFYYLFSKFVYPVTIVPTQPQSDKSVEATRIADSSSRNAVSFSFRTHNETLSFAMCVHNPDRSPFKIEN
jgi:hypothetical protein